MDFFVVEVVNISIIYLNCCLLPLMQGMIRLLVNVIV